MTLLPTVATAVVGWPRTIRQEMVFFAAFAAFIAQMFSSVLFIPGNFRTTVGGTVGIWPLGSLFVSFSFFLSFWCSPAP